MGRKPSSPEDQRRAGQLGDSLRRRREEKGLSIQDLSDESGVRYETVRSLLIGKSAGPSFFLVADLAAALEAPLDELAQEAR